MTNNENATPEANGTEWESLKVEYLPTVSLTNKEGKPGASLIGYFLSSRTVEYNFHGSARKQKVHMFQLIETNQALTQDVDGHLVNINPTVSQKIEVWGAGQLDWFLSKVQPGKKVKIDYVGKPLVNGEPCHQFDFKVSKDAPIETIPF